jgi:spore coat protein U-like protein
MTLHTARPAARLALSLLACGAAQAFAGNGTLTANTQVDTNCNVSTTALVFGVYDPILGNKTLPLNTSSGKVTITCVKDTQPTIALSFGSFLSGGKRHMRHGTNLSEFLPYELYQPSTTAPGGLCVFPGTVAWGTVGAEIFTPPPAPNKNSRSFNVCGTVPAGQNVEVGTYSDTVTATVTF